MNKMTVAEKFVKEQSIFRGWDVIKPSWPDLLMIHNQTGDVRLVEVKGRGDRISLKQRQSFKELQRAGFEVWVVFIDSLFDPKMKEELFQPNLNVRSVKRKRQKLGQKPIQDSALDQWLKERKDSKILLNPKEEVFRDRVKS